MFPVLYPIARTSRDFRLVFFFFFFFATAILSTKFGYGLPAFEALRLASDFWDGDKVVRLDFGSGLLLSQGLPITRLR